MKWNVALYEQFGKERMQPILDLVHRLPQGAYQRILDVGCGSGMSTLPLKEIACDEAEIWGVDASKEMLNRAQEVSSEIHWLQRDCSQDLSDLGTFDLVFSNAFLQWLPDQEAFIAHTKTLLKEGGLLAMQVPDYDSMPFKACVDRVASQFDRSFDKVKRMIYHNQCLGAYYDILTRYYKEVIIWKTQYVHVLSSYEEMVAFMSSTGLRPYLEALEDEQDRTRFISLLIEELKEAYPIQENGKILYPFERMEWIAQ